MDTSYSSSLQHKHEGLERKIEEEMSRPMPDPTMLQVLKKQKLRIKEQLQHH